jgi:hypothetical protein
MFGIPKEVKKAFADFDARMLEVEVRDNPCADPRVQVIVNLLKELSKHFK